jgi:hypothetical protein
MTLAACRSGPPLDVGDRDANDLDRLAASLDALALCYCTPDVEEADCRDGSGKTSVGEVVAMPLRSIVVPGVFELGAISAMSEAFEAACEVHPAKVDHT